MKKIIQEDVDKVCDIIKKVLTVTFTAQMTIGFMMIFGFTMGIVMFLCCFLVFKGQFWPKDREGPEDAEIYFL